MQPEQFMAAWETTNHQMRCSILKITRRSDVVDDIMQDIFINCYQRTDHLEQSFAVKYLMRAATNAAISYIKNGWVSKRIYDAAEPHSSETPLTKYSIMEQDELYRMKVLPALEKLPARQRIAIEAYMSFPTRKAAARAMGIPIATLWYNEMAALKSLRKKLDKRGS
jgi:RNA polymerase sigma factor (sigma-70 family)